MVTFETDDDYSIQFEISNNSSTIRLLIQFQMKKTLLVQHHNAKFTISLLASTRLYFNFTPDQVSSLPAHYTRVCIIIDIITVRH